MHQLKWGVAFALATVLTLPMAQAEDEALSAFEMRADTNGDNKVSYEEFKAAYEARMKARFERLDINSDGFVDFKEKKIAKQKQEAKVAAKEEALREEIRKEFSEERKRRKRHFFKYQ